MVQIMVSLENYTPVETDCGQPEVMNGPDYG